VPNIFSPDAFDEANQAFCIDLFCELREYEIRVYDNNGNITFQSTDVNACWDGYFNGVRAEIGVYVYRIDFLDKFGVARSKFGDITLIY
jgi:gliding motility-associated-like protein